MTRTLKRSTRVQLAVAAGALAGLSHDTGGTFKAADLADCLRHAQQYLHPEDRMPITGSYAGQLLRFLREDGLVRHDLSGATSPTRWTMS